MVHILVVLLTIMILSPLALLAEGEGFNMAAEQSAQVATVMTVTIFTPLTLLAEGEKFKADIELAAQVATVIIAAVAVYGMWPRRVKLGIYPWQDSRTEVNASYQPIKNHGPFNVFTIENWSEKDVLIRSIRFSPYGVIGTWMLLSCPVIMNFVWKNGLFFIPHPEGQIAWIRDPVGRIAADKSWPSKQPLSPMGAINIYVFFEAQEIPQSVIVSIRGQRKQYIAPIRGWNQTHKTLDEFKMAMSNSIHIIRS